MRKLTLILGAVLLLSPLMGWSQGTPLSRADAARILLLNRTDNIPLFPNNNRFPDVPKGHPMERYLLAAERYGILSSDPVTGLLRPDDLVDRASFLKMITLTFGLSSGLPESYSDVKKGDWYFPYAGLADNYDLFPHDGTLLHPLNPVSQDDAITALARLEDALQGSKQEQQLAKDQSDKKLQLYIVISTKRLNTVFNGDAPKTQVSQLTTTNDAKLEDLRQEVLNLVNGQRAKAGVGPLKLNTLLDGSAQQYAKDMAKEGFFSHVSPDGQTLRDRISVSGYYNRNYSEGCHCIPGYALAENLARGQRTPKEAVEAWMKSQSHREAMLSADYSDTGIGIEAGLWVEHFGGIIAPSTGSMLSKK